MQKHIPQALIQTMQFLYSVYMHTLLIWQSEMEGPHFKQNYILSWQMSSLSILFPQIK